MGIEKILNELTENCGQIYGYEIYHYPRQVGIGFIRCIRYVKLEKGFFWFKMPMFILLYCEKGVIVLEYYSLHIEEEFRKWREHEALKKWNGLSIDTIYILYIIFVVVFEFFLLLISDYSILIDITFACFLIFWFFMPGVIFCYLYRKKHKIKD